MSNDMLTAALKYAERGWYVFPVREKDGKPYQRKIISPSADGKPSQIKIETVKPLAKQPYIKFGLNAASTDEEIIRKWWKKYPNAGIGVNCGISGLFVVDIDMKKGNGYANFMKLGISTDGAFISMTPSGGLHVIYSGIGKSTSNVDTQIDTRSLGGYIIAPPSYTIGEDGKTHKYSAVANWDGEPVKIPPDLLKVLQIGKKTRPNPKYVNVDIDDVEIEKAKKAMKVLPVSLAHTHEIWFQIGASLKPLGELGFIMWEWWTEKYFEEKPDSTRRGTLEYKWRRFHEDGAIQLGTLYYYAYKHKEEESK